MSDRFKTRSDRSVLATALLGVITLAFSAGIIVFDFFVIHGIVQQSRAEHFPTTTGTVIESRVEKSTGDPQDGPSYHARIRYAYRVNGKQYDSTRYRFGITPSDSCTAYGLARAYPLGSHPVVHYRPDAPSQAVLRPGVDGFDRFLLMCVPVLNLPAAYLWVGLLAMMFRKALDRRETGGVQLIHHGLRVHARLPRVSAGAVFAMVLLVASMGALAVVALQTGASPGMRDVWLGWGGALGIALFAGGIAGARTWAGRNDLVIDPMRRTVTLPRSFGQKTPITVAFTDITQVTIKEQASRGGNGERITFYLPTLHFRGADRRTQAQTLAKWTQWKDAKAFARWLRERAGLEPGELGWARSESPNSESFSRPQ